MDQIIAWLVFLIAYLLPLCHVAVTPYLTSRPKISSCPFSPKTGWIVIILFLGPIGWLMFQRSRKAHRKIQDTAANS